MNQIQRDLTYRLDALQLLCNEQGFESKECQQMTQIWEQQHSSNIRLAKIESFNSVIWSFIFLFFSLVALVIIAFSMFLKYKSLKKELDESLKKY